MCGIAGIVDLEGLGADAADVEGRVAEMCARLVHRGPDDRGILRSGDAVLGHRRLAVLDLSATGHQPMSAGGRHVVFNGEIYNHAELRRELEGLGQRFVSRTDTEVVLHGHRRWGDAGLIDRLRGMWAFALWDETQRSLLLSRDRLGEKPLYYSIQGARLAFASSLPALALAMGERRVDPRAVAGLFAYGYVPGDACIYHGAAKLPPGHGLRFDRDGVQVRRYWRPAYEEDPSVSEDDAAARVEEMLEAAVGEQLVADVPVGVFLSGGTDSGLVAALAARRRPAITTITMSVPGSIRDESEAAGLVARHLGTSHLVIPMDASCIRDLPAILATGEPLGDSSIIPTAAVAAAARGRVKVVLTGDGGDELFDGYGAPRAAVRAAALRGRRPLAPVIRFLAAQRLHPLLRYARLHAGGDELLAAAGVNGYLEAMDFTSPDVRGRLFGPALRQLGELPRGGYLRAAAASDRAEESWQTLLRVGLETRMADDFLVKVDMATMFHSVESRAPFLDPRLVTMAARLPWRVLMPDGNPKGLLRRVAARHIPASVVYAAKKGFSLPVERYFMGGWGGVLNGLVAGGVAADLGLIEPAGVGMLLERHGPGASARLNQLLFSILALEVWLRVVHAGTSTAEELGDRLLSAAGSADGRSVVAS